MYLPSGGNIAIEHIHIYMYMYVAFLTCLHLTRTCMLSFGDQPVYVRTCTLYTVAPHSTLYLYILQSPLRCALFGIMNAEGVGLCFRVIHIFLLQAKVRSPPSQLHPIPPASLPSSRKKLESTSSSEGLELPSPPASLRPEQKVHVHCISNCNRK